MFAIITFSIFQVWWCDSSVMRFQCFEFFLRAIEIMYNIVNIGFKLVQLCEGINTAWMKSMLFYTFCFYFSILNPYVFCFNTIKFWLSANLQNIFFFCFWDLLHAVLIFREILKICGHRHRPLSYSFTWAYELNPEFYVNIFCSNIVGLSRHS
jgi:hypothetical protein